MRRILLPLLALAVSLCLVGSAQADQRISATSGAGKKAAAAAKQRTGGGTVLRVTKDTDDSDRSDLYEVVIRRRAAGGTVFRYEVSVSSTFRVTDVDREIEGSEDD
jgi:hypothetical protein